jgi:thiol-disulfide isomerase/thioredoxin
MNRLCLERIARRMLATVVLVASLCACSGPTHNANEAPNFVRTDLDHHRIELRQLRGKVVLVNFWASWCPPCREEMPAFVQWQREFGGQGFQVIGVAMDDSSTAARAAVTQMHLDYPVVMGDEELAKAYGGILGLPISFLIDRDGNIVRRFTGVNLPALRAGIVGLLANRSGRTVGRVN